MIPRHQTTHYTDIHERLFWDRSVGRLVLINLSERSSGIRLTACRYPDLKILRAPHFRSKLRGRCQRTAGPPVGSGCAACDCSDAFYFFFSRSAPARKLSWVGVVKLLVITPWRSSSNLQSISTRLSFSRTFQAVPAGSSSLLAQRSIVEF